jgi:hypothetical protein
VIGQSRGGDAAHHADHRHEHRACVCEQHRAANDERAARPPNAVNVCRSHRMNGQSRICLENSLVFFEGMRALNVLSAPRCLIMRFSLDRARHRQIQVVNRPRSLNGGVQPRVQPEKTCHRKALPVYLQEPTYLRMAGHRRSVPLPDSCIAAKLSIIRSDNRAQLIRSTSVVGPDRKRLSGFAMSARLQVIAPTGWCAGGGPPKWLAAGLCDH